MSINKDKDYIKIHPDLYVKNKKNFEDVELFIELPKNNKIIALGSDLNKNIDLAAKSKNSDQSLLIKNDNASLILEKTVIDLNSQIQNISDVHQFKDFFIFFEQTFDMQSQLKINLSQQSELKNTMFRFFTETVKVHKNNYYNISGNTVLYNRSIKKMLLTLFLAQKASIIKENLIYNINTCSFFSDISLIENSTKHELHTLLSAALINKEKSLYNEDVYLGILHHHEYLDGSGLLKMSKNKVHDYGNLICLVEDYLDGKIDFRNTKNYLNHLYHSEFIHALSRITALHNG